MSATNPIRTSVPSFNAGEPSAAFPEGRDAAAAPSLERVKGEAIEQLKTDFSDDAQLPRKKLECNWKMRLGIVVGVLVGVLVLAVVLGAIIASHGALGAVLGIVATKLSLGSAIAAHGIGGLAGGHMGATALAWIAKVISAAAVATVFLGGGKIGGELWRRGEAEQMDALLKGSSKKIRELEDKAQELGVSVTEEEVQNYIAEQRATILSSQAGRNFVDTERRAHLHYAGLGDLITSPIKAFGHFWTGVPTTSLRSISDRSRYDRFCQYVDWEKQLKDLSVGASQEAEQNLNGLNALRATQVEQLVWRTDAMGSAYGAAPEIQVYDQNIARLGVLKNKLQGVLKRQEDQKNKHLDNKKFYPDGDPLHSNMVDLNNNSIESSKALIQAVDLQLAVEKEKKSQLIAKRLEGTPALKNTVVSSDVGASVKSLLTIERDVMGLPNLSKEHKGQILEAVSILLTQNPKTTISDVNELVNSLSTNLVEPTAFVSPEAFESVSGQQWKTREWAIGTAQAFAQAKLEGGSPPVVQKLAPSEKRCIMTKESGSFLALKALDVFISLIHMIPMPGSSVAAAGLTGVAVGVEKGVSPSQLFRKKINTSVPPSTAPTPADRPAAT